MPRTATSSPQIDDVVEARLGEVARILALGILRLRSHRRETSDGHMPESGNFGVDFDDGQSVDAQKKPIKGETE